MEKDNKTREVFCYCAKCNRKTYHHTVGEGFVEPPDNPFVPDELLYTTYYDLAQCDACHKICFVSESYYDDDPNLPLEFRNLMDCKVYPGVNDIIDNEEFKQYLPPQIYKIYCESVTAINAKCFQLAMVGFRSTIEGICKDKNVVDLSSIKLELVGLIDLLEENRVISKLERNRLHSIRIEGNGSVHENSEIPEKDIFVIKDIVDNLIKNLYVFERQETSFKKPIIEFEEFEKHLKACLTEDLVEYKGVYTLKKIVKNKENDRLINNDLKDFEKELRQRINQGIIKYLSIKDDTQFVVERVYAI